MAPRVRIDIPESIKREVRQRCGFGCVICGLPLYEYEHLLGYANVERHVASEITLLCDRHHREKTAKLLPLDAVKAADRNPFNLRMGNSTSYPLHYSGDRCQINVGSCSFVSHRTSERKNLRLIVIDDVTVFGFQMDQGHLLLTLRMFDRNNKRVLEIVNNELIYSVSAWDISLVGQQLTIHAKKYSPIVKLFFQVPNQINVVRAHFFFNGVEIVIGPSPDLFFIVNGRMLISNNHSLGIDDVVSINSPLPEGYTCHVKMRDVSRSIPNREELLRWATKQVRNPRTGGGI